MRKTSIIGAVAAALALAPAATAQAAVPSVFNDAGAAKIACNVQKTADATNGQRWCGGPSGQVPAGVSRIPSWDGTPIDVSVALPPVPATGPDGNFPVVGLYHGYGSAKILPSSGTAQRWLAQGYAVFSITDRGFWGSCGKFPQLGANQPAKPAGCGASSVIHLMSNAYEVHDAQHLMGMLADDGVIDPQRIGATGGSYGGGMAAQLGALKDRVQQPDGTLVPWTSPRNKTPMKIAATAPQYGWSDLIQALMPNGSGLDYAAYNPYSGPAGDRRFGIQKLVWNLQLYGGGDQTGYYAPPNSDPTANIAVWLNTNLSGGPYDGEPFVDQQLEQFPSHGSYGTNDSVAPAPALISNGWNDDLFPVDEALRYYNKVRANHPTTPIKLIGLDLGHANRSAASPGVADATRVATAENEWFAHYVRGDGATPSDAVGGVTAITSVCPIGSGGTVFEAKNWASLAKGEVRLADAAAQTVAADTTPVNRFSPADPRKPDAQPVPDVCTSGNDTDTTGAAIYETPAAPAGGYTIAGAPTILADLAVKNVNDAVVGRLYDVDPAGMQRLIARGTYRPTNPGTTSRQVFQLHPQAWKVAEGHTVKLELLGRDAPYALPASGQAPVGVSGLELRLPTVDAPGAAGGQVKAPAAKVLPAGYALAADEPKPVVPTPAPAPVLVPDPAPAPVTAPAPAPKQDALTPALTVAGLQKAPGAATISKSLRTVKFRDLVPQAGRISYTLTIRVRGKDRTVGTAVRRVTKAARITVTIKPTAAGRRLLKANPRAKLTLRSTFVTANENRTLKATRTLPRKSTRR
ncbi:CocE/NonD family hydrolase [Patulibacter sp.]|uniref:CocE/NonD family hydrolase n=1 Tax=Patulibacter sp. TaxID=1912859 RepID=UPI0027206A6C|nr:CocE/NonD family hydrolase [Patulibacter sp.]MDO9409460.1 CocE/NonD family hydrolase [Patulibacter sp.]